MFRYQTKVLITQNGPQSSKQVLVTCLSLLSRIFIFIYLFNHRTEAKKKKYQEYRRLMLLLAKVPQTGQYNT